MAQEYGGVLGGQVGKQATVGGSATLYGGVSQAAPISIAPSLGFSFGTTQSQPVYQPLIPQQPSYANSSVNLSAPVSQDVWIDIPQSQPDVFNFTQTNNPDPTQQLGNIMGLGGAAANFPPPFVPSQLGPVLPQTVGNGFPASPFPSAQPVGSRPQTPMSSVPNVSAMDSPPQAPYVPQVPIAPTGPAAAADLEGAAKDMVQQYAQPQPAPMMLASAPPDQGGFTPTPFGPMQMGQPDPMPSFGVNPDVHKGDVLREMMQQGQLVPAEPMGQLIPDTNSPVSRFPNHFAKKPAPKPAASAASTQMGKGGSRLAVPPPPPGLGPVMPGKSAGVGTPLDGQQNLINPPGADASTGYAPDAPPMGAPSAQQLPKPLNIQDVQKIAGVGQARPLSQQRMSAQQFAQTLMQGADAAANEYKPYYFGTPQQPGMLPRLQGAIDEVDANISRASARKQGIAYEYSSLSNATDDDFMSMAESQAKDMIRDGKWKFYARDPRFGIKNEQDFMTWAQPQLANGIKANVVAQQNKLAAENAKLGEHINNLLQRKHDLVGDQRAAEEKFATMTKNNVQAYLDTVKQAQEHDKSLSADELAARQMAITAYNNNFTQWITLFEKQLGLSEFRQKQDYEGRMASAAEQNAQSNTDAKDFDQQQWAPGGRKYQESVAREGFYNSAGTNAGQIKSLGDRYKKALKLAQSGKTPAERAQGFKELEIIQSGYDALEQRYKNVSGSNMAGVGATGGD